jgi:hypothetical protein
MNASVVGGGFVRSWIKDLGKERRRFSVVLAVLALVSAVRMHACMEKREILRF